MGSDVVTIRFLGGTSLEIPIAGEEPSTAEGPRPRSVGELRKVLKARTDARKPLSFACRVQKC